MKKIFITGGSGFLGQRVIARLEKEGWQIFSLVRDQSAARKLAGFATELVKGSMEDIGRWQLVLEEIDVVIHCASPVDFSKPWAFYQRHIVDATRNLYQAALGAGVKRFVYISSDSVLQDKEELVDVDETAPYPPAPNSFYGKAKLLAEQFLTTRRNELEVIVIRPPFIWGKGVPALMTLLEKVQSKRFWWIDEGKSMMEMVHVDNAAEAIYLSTFKGKPGSVYFVTDNNPQPVKDFLTKLLDTVAVKAPEKYISKWWATFFAYVVEEVWSIFEFKKTPPLTRCDVAFMSLSRKYDISKIRDDMGYIPVVWEDEGLEEMRKG